MRGWTWESYWIFDRVFAALMAWREAQRSSMVCSSWRSRSYKGEVSGTSSTMRWRDGFWYSIGSTDSTPCTRWKGVKWLQFLWMCDKPIRRKTTCDASWFCGFIPSFGAFFWWFCWLLQLGHFPRGSRKMSIGVQISTWLIIHPIQRLESVLHGLRLIV